MKKTVSVDYRTNPQQVPHRPRINLKEVGMAYSNAGPWMSDDGMNSVNICSPKRLEEVQILIDTIKKKQPLIMDLTGLSDDVACRILDFMSGAVYALSGSMQNYKGSFYLITPEGCVIKKIVK